MHVRKHGKNGGWCAVLQRIMSVAQGYTYRSSAKSRSSTVMITMINWLKLPRYLAPMNCLHIWRNMSLFLTNSMMRSSEGELFESVYQFIANLTTYAHMLFSTDIHASHGQNSSTVTTNDLYPMKPLTSWINYSAMTIKSD